MTPATPATPTRDGHPRTVLLTGATGFVGRAVLPALVAAGWQVRCFTRDAKRAAAQLPLFDWMQVNVEDAPSLSLALAGCTAAMYLVHSMAEGAAFAERKVVAAQGFARAAAQAGLARIVYLGGLAPTGEAASHLRSRLAVGETLRAGPVPAILLFIAPLTAP